MQTHPLVIVALVVLTIAVFWPDDEQTPKGQRQTGVQLPPVPPTTTPRTAGPQPIAPKHGAPWLDRPNQAPSAPVPYSRNQSSNGTYPGLSFAPSSTPGVQSFRPRGGSVPSPQGYRNGNPGLAPYSPPVVQYRFRPLQEPAKIQERYDGNYPSNPGLAPSAPQTYAYPDSQWEESGHMTPYNQPPVYTLPPSYRKP